MELTWLCSMCGQDIRVRPIGWNRSMATLKKALLVKVDDHIDFHTWQFGHEIDHAWLEEREMWDEEEWP